MPNLTTTRPVVVQAFHYNGNVYLIVVQKEKFFLTDNFRIPPVGSMNVSFFSAHGTEFRKGHRS